MMLLIYGIIAVFTGVFNWKVHEQGKVSWRPIVWSVYMGALWPIFWAAMLMYWIFDA